MKPPVTVLLPVGSSPPVVVESGVEFELEFDPALVASVAEVPADSVAELGAEV
jgi:hypothetical protein